MAGTWIKVGVSIHNKPEVLGIAQECGLGVDTVVGKLVRMWAWFDEMSEDGHVPYGTNVWLDSYVGHEGFARACDNVGWLEVNETGLTMPNFDRHNGESSKKRLTDAARKRSARDAKAKRPQNVREMSAKKTDKSGTREEKRREDKKKNKARKRARFDPDTVEIPDELLAYEASIRTWLRYKQERGETYKPTGLTAFFKTCVKKGNRLPDCIEHSMASNWAGIFDAPTSKQPQGGAKPGWG